MHWVQRKIYLYNVTFGLYMLDWWERYLFNTLVIVLMWFIFYNSSRYVADFCKSKKLVTTTLVSEWLKLDSIVVIIQALFLIGIIEFAKADLSADEVDDKNCLH